MKNKLLFKVMRLLVLFWLVGFMHVSAATFSQTVTLKGESLELGTVFNAVRKQTGLGVYGFQSMFDGTHPVTVDVKAMPLDQFLGLILKNQPLEARVEAQAIVISRRKEADKPRGGNRSGDQIQQQTVSGTVTDEQGNPLEGVTVTGEGTFAVATTDREGNYKISIPSSRTKLLFTIVGFHSSAQVIGNRQRIDVVMQTLITNLEEVVAIGYGTVKRGDLTGAVGKATFKDQAEQFSVSIEQLLQGRVSGVQITPTSGAPDGGILFNIRGMNSLSSNQPLIVIDGYPIDSESGAVTTDIGADYWSTAQPPRNALSLLNPNDIESVEILKDASSTAIYGSRGANGVVMITTKRGRQGRDKISYNFRVDFSGLPKTIDVLSGPEFIQYANEAAMNDGRDSIFNSIRIGELAGIDNNWQDLIFRNSKSSDHQISISGGDSRTKYSIMANYSSIDGVVNLSNFKKGGVRINLDREVSRHIDVGLNINTSYGKSISVQQSTNHADLGGSVVAGALRFSPLSIPFDDGGELDLALQNNPMATLMNTDNVNSTSSIITNFFLNYKIGKDLKFRFNGGLNQIDNTRNTYYGRGTYNGDTNGGQAYQGESKRFNYLTEYTLNYRKVVGGHSLDILGGFTWQAWKSSSLGTGARSFTNDNLSYYALHYGGLVSAPITNHLDWALSSFLARLNYSFKSKYYLTVTSRYDGSSRLGANNKWAMFPSVAAAWNLSNEDFLKGNDFISQLKIRGSIGVSGNQSIAVGATKALLANTRAAVDYGKIGTGIVLSSFENNALHWEITHQQNVGVDFKAVSGKYGLSIDVYKKQTEGLLMNLAIPADNGFTSYATNAGNIANSGIDISADAAISSGQLGWNVFANISFNRNKIVDLGSNATIMGTSVIGNALNQPATIAKPGYPIGAFYGYRVNGIYQNQAQIDSGPEDAILPKPGDFRYADVGGADGFPDGQITVDDRTIIGDPNPNFTFGIGSDLSWKKFALSFLFNGSIGNDIANLNRYYSDGLLYPIAGNIRREAWEGRWTGAGTSEYYPRARMTGSLLDNRFSSYLIEDGSFVRLKNLNVSYNHDFVNLPYISSLKVFLSATNLFILTRYKGFDPEVSAFGFNALLRNIDYGTIPQFRTFSLGLNVTL